MHLFLEDGVIIVLWEKRLTLSGAMLLAGSEAGRHDGGRDGAVGRELRRNVEEGRRKRGETRAV
jgi:hypothetical protein